MIIWGAATLAYDDNEVHLNIETEKGESISLGDLILIPMNDHSFEKRKVVGIFKNWKKWRDGKSLNRINEEETATVVVRDIHSGKVHTVSSPYDDEELGNECVTADNNFAFGSVNGRIPIYKMKFMFDWGSGVCLWSTNEAAIKKYDYPVETSSLHISDSLKEQLESLIEKHDEALNWQEPQSELLWSEEQQQSFIKEAKQAYMRIVQELGADYEIVFFENLLI